MRKSGMNGSDSTADRATRLLPPNMAESTAHTEGGHGLGHGVHTTDTELWRTWTHPTDLLSLAHTLSDNKGFTWKYEEMD